MKKIFFQVLILILLIIIPIYAQAETCDLSSIKLESIELNKTEGNAKELSIASISDKKIKLDIKLYDPGDYLEYNLLLKNTSNEDYYFDENSLKLNIDYLEYKFNYGDNSNIVKAGEEKIIKLRVEYKNKVPSEKLDNGIYKNTNSMNIVLANKDLNIFVNPETVNMIKLFILIVLTVIVLMTIKVKKEKNYLTLLFGIALILPITVYAICKSNIIIETKVEIDGKEAYFLTGQEVNIKMKEVAGDDTSIDAYNTADNNITTILHSNTEPASINKEDKNIVSTPESPYPIYMWYENGTVYWWSEDLTPNVNEDASYMFKFLCELINISGLEDFDTSNTKNMRSLFSGANNSGKPTKLNDLKPLSNWNISKVTNMYAMFQGNIELTSLNGLENWDVSNVTDMSGMFADNVSLTTLDGLENWDVSNVETMFAMFLINGSTYSSGKRSSLEDISALKNWNTSKVTSLRAMFQYADKLTTLDSLSNWDTSSVTTIHNMFNGCTSLTNIDGLANWNISNVEDMGFTFDKTAISNLTPLRNWNTSSVTNMEYLFSRTNISNLLPLANWNVSNLETMGSMFRNCRSLTTLDGLQNWDVSKVTNFSEGNDSAQNRSQGTFEGLTNLTDASAINNWNINREALFDNMFKNTPVHPEFSKITGTWNNGTFIPN